MRPGTTADPTCAQCSGGLPTSEPDQIERSLQLLKVPRIRVNKLPAVSGPRLTG